MLGGRRDRQAVWRLGGLDFSQLGGEFSFRGGICWEPRPSR